MTLDRGVAPNEGIGGFLIIHRFAHESVRGESSGGVSTAQVNDFPAFIFLTGLEKLKFSIVIHFRDRNGAGIGWERGWGGLRPLRKASGKVSG